MERTRERARHGPGPIGHLIAFAAAAALLAACGPTGGGGTVAPATAAPATAAQATAEPSEDADYTTLEIAEDSSLGGHVVGADGMSLYVFTPDTETSSSCVDTCAENWPPLTVDDEDDVEAGSGVTGDLGTITRADGSLQVTLGGHPLYYFGGDKAAGDVNGQGLNDVWYVAGADGSGVGMAEGPGPSPTKCGGRTCY